MPIPYDAMYFHGRGINAYNRIFGLKGFVTRWLRRRLPPRAQVLDVGCGTGLYLAELRWIENRYGCDVSEFAIEQARASVPDVTFALAPPERDLPFAEIAFDLVTAFDVIEHVADDAVFLRRLGERLKTGGLLVLSTPNPRSLGRRIKKERWFAYRDPTHINIREPRHFFELLDGGGFEVLCARFDGFWDTPYFTRFALLERVVIQLPSVLAFNFAPFRSDLFGENLWVIARKR